MVLDNILPHPASRYCQL